MKDKGVNKKRKRTINKTVYLIAYEDGVWDETAKITRIQKDVSELIALGKKRIQVFARGESLRVI